MPYNWDKIETEALLAHEEQLGYEAGAQGLTVNHNPNKQGTPEYKAWWIGWQKANQTNNKVK